MLNTVVIVNGRLPCYTYAEAQKPIYLTAVALEAKKKMYILRSKDVPRDRWPFYQNLPFHKEIIALLKEVQIREGGVHIR